jgi:hypothetical protein
MPEYEKPKIAAQIFGISCSLLGLCCLLINSISHFGAPDKTVIHKMAGIAGVLFLASGIFSYVSMRIALRAGFFEKISEIIFIIGLLLLALVSLAVIVGVIE